MQRKKQKSKKLGVATSLFLASIMCLSTIVNPFIGTIKAETTEEAVVRPLIPKPLTYETNSGNFELPESVSFQALGNNDEETNELMRLGEYAAVKFRASTGYAIPVEKGDEAVGNIVLSTVDANEDLGTEGYEIVTTEEGVEIKAYESAGVFNAIQTLRQLLPDEIEKPEVNDQVAWQIPCSTIYDKPEYEYRGIMMDVSRHFFTVEQVKRQIELASQYKINKLHMHLSDDQGWRLEIKGDMYGESLDKLNTIGAQTSTSINGIRAGQYTQEEFKEIVQYATDHYVEVIPEFDMPGHTWAALVSLNFLNSTEDGKPHSGNYNNTKPYEGIDVGFSTFEAHNEKTYEFIDEVFKQVSAISPSEYIHVGGDEAHSTSSADYAYFCNRVTEIAKKYGKTAIGWQNYDAIVEDKENTLTQYWDNKGSKFKEGINYIVAPANHAYMDMQYDSGSKYGLKWAGYNPVDNAYNWDPTDYGSKDQVKGVEAPLWAETLNSDEALDYMFYPRLGGFAEIGWTPKEDRSWDEYKPRIAAHADRLTNQGIQFRKDEKIWEPKYDPINSYWNMNEGEGTTITDDTKTKIGNISTGVTWEDGVKGSALNFAGTGYVDLNIPDLKGSWSIGMWVQRAKNTSTNTVLISGTQGEIKLEQWKNTGKVGLTEFGVKDYTFNYTAPIDEWVQLTFVCDGSKTSLYANGELKDELAVAIKGPATRLGANAKVGLADTGFMFGSLDEVRIYNRVMSVEEIKELYEQDVTTYSKEDLQTLIDTVTALEEANYTAETWAVLATAQTNAMSVMEDELATEDAITAAYIELNTAYKNLKEAQQDNQIRVASYNIAAGKKPNIASMNAQLDEYDIDVVGIQEVDHFNSRNNYDMLKKFADFGSFPYYSFQKAIDYGGGAYGIGAISRFEILEKTGGSLNSEGTSEARAWQRILFEVDGKEVALYNTHLTFEGIPARERQLREVLAIMDADPCEYKMLTGDFNTDQSITEVYPILENYNITNGNEGVWFDTYNQKDDTMNVYSIDNIVTTRNMEIREVGMEANNLSDHNMLFAELELLDEEVPSKQLLDFVLEDAKAIEGESYTEASFAALTEAIQHAEALADTATQQEIDDAVASLQAAVDALEYRYLVINDAQTGTDLNQFNYVGKWEVSTGYPDLFYKGDEHWFNFGRFAEGDTVPYFTIDFEGTGIEIFGNIDTMMGIYEVTLDDNATLDIDAYNPEKKTQSLLYSVRDLPYGKHTIKVQATQRKNTASTSTDIEVDFAKVYNEQRQEEDTTALKQLLQGAITKAQAAITSGQVDTLAPAVQAMLTTYFSEAQAVLADQNATSSQILEAWLNLATALHYLDFEANKQMLAVLIAECDEIQTGTDNSGLEAFKLALANAKVVYEDETALQARIDKTYQALSAARDGLLLDHVDKEMLNTLIISISEAIANADLYCNDERWAALVTTYEEAKRIVENVYASQGQINDVFARLGDAYENIRLLPNEELLQQLQAFVNAAMKLDETRYTADDYAFVMRVKEDVSRLMAMDYIPNEEYQLIEEDMVSAWSIIRNNIVDVPSSDDPVVDTPSDTPVETPSDIEDQKTPNATVTEQPRQAINQANKTVTGDVTNTLFYMALFAGAGMAIFHVRRRFQKN